jgi:hypothetical protein
MDRRNLDLETANAEIKRRYGAANPQSRTRFEAAQAVMPGPGQPEVRAVEERLRPRARQATT